MGITKHCIEQKWEQKRRKTNSIQLSWVESWVQSWVWFGWVGILSPVKWAYAQTFSKIHLKFKYLNYNNNNKFEVVHKISNAEAEAIKMSTRVHANLLANAETDEYA